MFHISHSFLKCARAPLAVAVALISAASIAQDSDLAIEEVIVVGSQ
ncbi:MAG: hypothetical protein HOI00_08490, partial [Halieaceae bacterium]|nr:hypothetical protein [Halieaceae bacterium]